MPQWLLFLFRFSFSTEGRAIIVFIRAKHELTAYQEKTNMDTACDCEERKQNARRAEAPEEQVRVTWRPWFPVMADCLRLASVLTGSFQHLQLPLLCQLPWWSL